MDKDLRNQLANAVQAIRRLLEEEFARQLEGTFDVFPDGRISAQPSAPLTAEQRFVREKIIAAIQHRCSKGESVVEAVYGYTRECAFTFLNRFAALKMMEARGLVQECVSRGDESAGFKEFGGLAPGLGLLSDRGYRLYLECLFDEIGREVGILFARADPASLLWPARRVIEDVLARLNDPSLASVWAADETIGWIYQYYNDPAERKKMRDKSAAPRNGRELAVRNQFFTPRYVVEFLTDNTLGRIWYEMTRGETKLKEQCRYLVRRPNEIYLQPGETAPEQPKHDNLSQEELLRQTVYIPHRPIKDPRTILMLDPACGSMHFGLYAFDLFEVIYDQAWELEKKLGADALSRPLEMKSLHDTYADKDAFLKDVPRLIIEHNLHGIDIDPRCAQLAGLSLWLRAQMAWQRLGLKPAERPAIKRSNIVCAEPMPGEKEQLKEFCDALKQPAIGQMVTVIFDKMRLAGEAGSLLKIEEEIRELVHDTKLRWTETYRFAQTPTELFSRAEIVAFSRSKTSAQPELNIDFAGITDEAFWDKAEERIYGALRDYAEQAENDGGFQRRLFAEDAARGFAFIDVCRKRYDVALMNPPFGEASEKLETYCNSVFQEWSGNLAAAFIGRTAYTTSQQGITGCICDHSIAIRSTYEDIRRKFFISENQLDTWIKLGWEVLDANVETFCATWRNDLVGRHGVFGVDLFHVSPTKKGGSLLEAIDEPMAQIESVSCFSHSTIAKLPNCVIDLTWPPFLIRLFGRFANLQQEGFEALVGHQLEADRHYRLYWEIDFKSRPLASGDWTMAFKGGDYAPGYLPEFFVAHTGPKLEKVPDTTANVLRNISFQHRSGVGYGKRGDFVDAQPLRPTSIFTHEGFAFILPDESDRWLVLTLLNSHLFSYGINKYCGQHKTNGYVNLFAFPSRANWRINEIRVKCSEFVRIKTRWTVLEEYDYLFSKPSLLLAENYPRQGIRDSLRDVVAAEKTSIEKLNRLFFELNQEVYDAYGLSKEETATCEEYCELRPKLWLSETGLAVPQTAKEVSFVEQLLSWAIGLVFGRWDIRYATGEKAALELPDPFAPLPVCPPGQLQNAQGLPARPDDVPASYPMRIPWDGILVDDPNHPLDIERRVREAIEIIWKDRGELIEHEACEILGMESLRDYFRKPGGFFADHLKRYSKSRRQAPIYWPLSSPRNVYTVWLYYHRLTADTFFTVLRDFVKPTLDDEDRRLFRLKHEAGPSPTPAQSHSIAEAEELVEDLRSFRDELQRIAPLWRPNLNDGVLINHAPLWRLAAHKPWQKKLKECWDELVSGAYDWAHLALHLWPERVIPKCVTDRSLAIAHDLDAVFWEEDARTGKPVSKKVAETEIAKLVAERTSPAVKAALESLQSALGGGGNKREETKKA